MSFNLGINVVEIDGQIPPSIQPAETSVTGFIIRAKRGIPGQVVAVTSWSRFVDHFGAHAREAFGAYAISGYFANGGTVALVTRIASENARAAEGLLEAPGGAALLHLTAAYRGEADPGEWGDDVAVELRPGLTEGRFDLAVFYPGLNGNEVELFEDLDLAESNHETIKERINGTSKYVKVEFEDAGSPPPSDPPHSSPGSSDPSVPSVDEEGSVSTTLSGGEDGPFSDSDVIAQRATSALDLFEVQSIQLLTCPETSSTAFAEAAISHCEQLGDRMFVGHVPLNAAGEIDEASLGSTLRSDKSYGALYGPNVMVLDPLGGRPKPIPPTGHVLGVYARTDRERGVWKAPAGDAARLRGVLDVSSRVNDVDHTRIVKQLGVNLIRPIVGKGIVIDSARTLSTNTKWLYVNVRLLFNFVKSSLKNNLRWVVGEPNDPKLWGRVKFDAVQPFLLGLWREGAFGPGTPDEVFTVKIDEDNNSPEDIEQGRLNVEVTFYPSRPAETIIVRVGQQMGASRASDG